MSREVDTQPQSNHQSLLQTEAKQVTQLCKVKNEAGNKLKSEMISLKSYKRDTNLFISKCQKLGK